MVFKTVMNNTQVQPNAIQNIPVPGSEQPAAVVIATSFPPTTGLLEYQKYHYSTHDLL